ncbi:hypothetical protein [Halosolutus gelatinilyticus]|uniref:hypothetical protein n=1 Tax=Halosolutus gelatinilyticus TaxID=2931975 RepID=UPI001FF194AD|nr:hypothetical protein [Halosolutus gelatinilyticus]
MNAATVDDLLARERRDDRTALVDATGREYDRHWLCTTSWKAGNFLRHAGVREGVTVGVAGEGPLALLACFGTTLLEGTTWFDPPTALSDVDDVRAIVAPVDDLDGYDLPRGAQRVGYGDAPDDPGVHHFDAGLWSENPSFPPLSIDPETDLLADGDRTLTHETALDSAGTIVDEYGLERGDRVVVRAPLSDPRTVVAGVIAPLLAEGPIVLAADVDERDERDDRGEFAVVGDADRSVPEATRIDLEKIRTK